MMEKWMELRNDELYKAGEDLKKLPGGAFYIRPPNWAQIRSDAETGLNIAAFFWYTLQPFYIIYGLAGTGAFLAWLFWQGAIALQQGQGFFHLGLGWGTFDALLFILGIACGVATIGGVIFAFFQLYWVSQIITLFYVYSFVVWAIHDFQLMAFPLGAYFFCWLVSLIIEGGRMLWHSRLN